MEISNVVLLKLILACMFSYITSIKMTYNLFNSIQKLNSKYNKKHPNEVITFFIRTILFFILISETSYTVYLNPTWNLKLIVNITFLFVILYFILDNLKYHSKDLKKKISIFQNFSFIVCLLLFGIFIL